MRRNTLFVDLGAAIVVAALLIILSDGPAVDAILVLVLLVVVGVSALLDRTHGRVRGPAVRRSRRP